MSHFTVFVVGKNPGKLLEPYSEYLKVKEWLVGAVSEEDKKVFMEAYQDDCPGKSLEEIYAKKGMEWNCNSWRKEEGVWKEYSTCNPEKRWDYWVEIIKLTKKAIEKYNAQPDVPDVIAFMKLGSLDAIDSQDRYLSGKEEYIDKRVMESIVPHAFLSKSTGWRENGRAGWFGTVTGKKKPDEWYREFMDFFDSLSEKEEIHIIDCHI